MTKLSEFMTECQKYIDASRKNNLAATSYLIFKRDVPFSQNQLKIMGEMIANIEKSEGDPARIKQAVQECFKKLKEGFLDYLFRFKHTNHAKFYGHRVVSFTSMNVSDETQCAKDIENGAGTAGMRMLFRFRKAVQERDFVFDGQFSRELSPIRMLPV